MTIFLSGRQRTGALCVQKNTVQLLQRSRVIHHLSEKCDFRVSPFYQVVQKHKLFEVKHILIAYFIGNIAAKKNIKKSVHVCQSYSKP